MSDIIITDLCKSFGDKKVLDNFSCTIENGQFSCLMSPSGSGKTTLLRIMLGLENADSGSISGLENAKISAVFQENRLLEHLSGSANIRLVCPELSEQAISRAMSDFGLKDSINQPVSQLSGGMKRRVSLLRALLFDCDLLLMDEPFKGLDETLKKQIIQFAKDCCIGKTVLLITHDAEEARAFGATKMLKL